MTDMLAIIVVMYITIGATLVIVGPAAVALREELASIKLQHPPKWKLLAFSLILALGVVFFWPVLVPSAARATKNRPSRQVPKRELTDLMEMMSSAGVDTDQLPGSYGEFGGLEVSNPIPCKGILGSRAYLERLRTPDGSTITYDRRGSWISQVSSHPIDGYAIANPTGRHLATIYISPYNRRNSSKAPKGFILNGSPDPEDHAIVAPTASEDSTSPDENGSPNATDEIPATPESENDGSGSLDPEHLLNLARSGDADAQFRVAVLFEEGKAFPMDLAAARRWYKRAALKGHGEAGRALDRLRPPAVQALPQSALDTNEQPSEPAWTVDQNGTVNPNLTPDHEEPKDRKSLPQARTRLIFGGDLLPLDAAQWSDIYALGLRLGKQCLRSCQRIDRNRSAAQFISETDRFVHLSESRTRATRLAERRGYLDEDADTGMEEAADGADPLFREKRLAFVEGVRDGIDEIDRRDN
ncbi:sel1 repeat family protein [Microvirga sp. 3-52]|uniref:tetratricopeptide repeat protein n=1 Tax=Microvirga sp. 3-52 TaxID=2792425 RepID=UPI001AC82EE2|nr:hypothetical protein [Microvirga sp. 3-52]MBO1906553.1 sel1 repeat family protein [Microvirga sp. 3-52]MBS7453848.1 sel1 repeat family protein [Microvirga sp. 3-52]